MLQLFSKIKNYPFKSEIPNKMNKNPRPITNQKTPPLRNVHAAPLKFQNEPHQSDEYHAIIIAAITSISPNKSSAHLFMFFIKLRSI